MRAVRTLRPLPCAPSGGIPPAAPVRSCRPPPVGGARNRAAIADLFRAPTSVGLPRCVMVQAVGINSGASSLRRRPLPGNTGRGRQLRSLSRLSVCQIELPQGHAGVRRVAGRDSPLRAEIPPSRSLPRPAYAAEGSGYLPLCRVAHPTRFLSACHALRSGRHPPETPAVDLAAVAGNFSEAPRRPPLPHRSRQSREYRAWHALCLVGTRHTAEISLRMPAPFYRWGRGHPIGFGRREGARERGGVAPWCGVDRAWRASLPDVGARPTGPADGQGSGSENGQGEGNAPLRETVGELSTNRQAGGSRER